MIIPTFCFKNLMASRVLPAASLLRSAEDPRSYRLLWLRGNQLRCMLVHDPRTDSAAAAASIRVGHFSDPPHLPGLAHFTEHMLFLGTEKYPHEGAYKQYLAAHGGSSNASTAMEHTTYHFSVAHDALQGALDRFAQFFVSPLFTPSATERELNAVNAEHAKNAQNDARRMFQLLKRLVCLRVPCKLCSVSIWSLFILQIMYRFASISPPHPPARATRCTRSTSLALATWARCATRRRPRASTCAQPSLTFIGATMRPTI